jgi:hypothetical protein
VVISDDTASDDEVLSQNDDGVPNDGLQFDDVPTDEDRMEEISTMTSKMEGKVQKKRDDKPKPKLAVHDGCRNLRRMFQDLILEGCTVPTAFSFARYHYTEKMNSFFEEFGVTVSTSYVSLIRLPSTC